MLPLAMGKAEYVKAIGPPFAVTVIGGLSISTIFTLVFIPMLYNGVEHAMRWINGLKLPLRLVMLVLQIAGMLLVIFFMDKFMWQMAAGLLVIVGIPVTMWFIMNSLRKATERIISEDETLHIKVSNLVKVYGRHGKVVRDYKIAQLMSARADGGRVDPRPKFQALIWQIPLILFLFYFSWIYLVQGLWQLIFAVAAYVYLLSIIKSFRRAYSARWLKLFYRAIRFFSPLLLIWFYQQKWDNIAITIIVGSFWYLGLLIGYVSMLIRKDGFDISSIKGRYRWFVKFVKFLPGVGSRREHFKALKGVSLEIGTGMFGLLGPNGAGKSTMIRVICGILEQSYGKIWINGIDTQKKREELQGLIGYLPQEFGMYENMTAYNYLEYQAMMKGINDVGLREKRIREVLESVHMWDSRNKKIGAYSGGMKQRIGIAQVLLHLPRILVVDEPTAGLDPRERIRFRNLLVELSRSRIVIFSTHIIEDISSSCNTMAVINKGEVLFSGSPMMMTEKARGKVWKATLTAKEFDSAASELLVIHHMRDGERIRMRCISPEKPFENAEEENPLLEDAYLWMLQTSKGE